jgi:hypothetical protein
MGREMQLYDFQSKLSVTTWTSQLTAKLSVQIKQ